MANMSLEDQLNEYSKRFDAELEGEIRLMPETTISLAEVYTRFLWETSKNALTQLRRVLSAGDDPDVVLQKSELHSMLEDFKAELSSRGNFDGMDYLNGFYEFAIKFI
jgi:hypothetical protein